VHISAFAAVTSAVSPTLAVSATCTQGTTFTSHASYFDALIWLLLTIMGIL